MCGCQMIDIQACHDLCPNCGAHLDCSDGPVGDPRACAAGTVKNRRSRTRFAPKLENQILNF